MNKKIQILAVMLCLGLLVAWGGLTTVQAATIGINFPGYTSDYTRALEPTDTAGFVAQTYWNNAPTTGTVGLTTVVNSAGAAVPGMSVTWTGPINTDSGAGAQANVPQDGDKLMYAGYIGSNLPWTGSTQDPTPRPGYPVQITVTGVPTGTYDVFVYMNRDSVETLTDGQITIGATSYYYHPIVGWSGMFVKATQTTAPGTIGQSPAANFCRFTGVSGGTVTINAQTLSTLNAGAGDGAQKGGAVCGIQFVPTSEIKASGTLTSPSGTNLRYNLGNMVTMSANVTVTGTTVTRVDFLINGVVVGSDTTATGIAYSYDWLVSPDSPLTDYVTARVYTADGRMYNTEGGVGFTVKTSYDVTDMGQPVSGTATGSANNNYPSQGAIGPLGAFDNNLMTGWDTASGGAEQPEWVQFELLTPQRINAVGYWDWYPPWSDGNGSESVKDFDVLGSNDGSTWDTLGSQRNLSQNTGPTISGTRASPYREFALPAKVGPYSYYRLYILANHGYGGQGVIELQFLDLPIGIATMVSPVGAVTNVPSLAPVALTANASGFAAAITNVYFFSGAVLLGEGTAVGANNYTLNWTPPDFGTYNIVAMVKTADATVKATTNLSRIVCPIYVTPAGGGTGETFASAFTMAEAVARRKVIPGGVDLFLKAGTHDVTTTLTLYTPGTVYGGFAGTETDPAQRVGDPFSVNVTKLDGKGAHQILCAQVAVALDRLTFVNGNSGGNGGGFRTTVEAGMTNCIFKNCTASMRGGGAYIAYVGSRAFSNVKFRENTAVFDGGGLFVNGGASPSFTNCEFTSNTATVGNGGGFRCGIDFVSVWDCKFVGNKAPLGYGGGFWNGYSGSNMTGFVRNVFIRNTANYGGGYAHTGMYVERITNNAFLYNTATTEGGAVYANGTCSFYFVNNTVVGNRTTNGELDGVYVSNRWNDTSYPNGYISQNVFVDHPKLAVWIDNFSDASFACKSNLFAGGSEEGPNGWKSTETGTPVSVVDSLLATGNNFVDVAKYNVDLIASAPANGGTVCQFRNNNPAALAWYHAFDWRNRTRPTIAVGESGYTPGCALVGVSSSLSVTPASTNFGVVLMGRTITMPLTLSASGGNTPVTITTATLTGNAAFRIESAPFSAAYPLDIMPGQTAVVQVSFTAPATTDKVRCEGTISFASTATNNPVTASLLGVSTVSLYPGSAPTVQITTTSPTPTHSFPIVFNVDFSEGVTGFTLSDLQWLGSIGGPSMTASLVPRGLTGANYSIVITDLPGVPSGTIQPSIPAGVAKSMTERASVGPVDGPAVSYDTTLLGVSILTGDGPVTDLTTVTYTLTFTQQITALPKTLLAPIGTSAGAALGALTTNNSTAWTLKVVTGADGTLGVALTDDDSIVSVVGAKKLDGTGNATLYGNMIDVEKTSPTLVSIQRAFGVKPGTNDPVVIFQVTFSQPVTNVTASDFEVTASGTGFAPANVVVLNGTAYVSCTTGTAIGPFSLSVKDNGTITNAKGLKYVPGTADPNEYFYILSVAPGETSAQTWSLY